ncbi:MAG: hypothetical protein KatS3mg022_3429 [Armatimonadota bacterium]|nr:MAG: hypothetical protein KatS3mg022_3429 [Armatimonadota bacterium]GIV21300.1 MAG: hypothetical protein KatS3mg023_3051 [Armatimonadota bacterium]GIV22022.1 MAG: hypothetical protein KatS3mg023_3773 [Armatimonadota bacterium]
MSTLNVALVDKARYQTGNTVYRFRYAVISDGDGTEVTAILVDSKVLYHHLPISRFVELVHNADDGDFSARLELHNLLHEAEEWQDKVLIGQ